VYVLSLTSSSPFGWFSGNLYVDLVGLDRVAVEPWRRPKAADICLCPPPPAADRVDRHEEAHCQKEHPERVDSLSEQLERARIVAAHPHNGEARGEKRAADPEADSANGRKWDPPQAPGAI